MVLLARIEESARMRRSGIRRIGAALAACVVTVGVLTATAGASADTAAGVGTSKVSTTVVGVQLGTDGSLLNLRILRDDGSSTIDAKVSQPSAMSRLTPLAAA